MPNAVVIPGLHFLNPHNLVLGTLFITVCIIVVVLTIFILLHTKRRHYLLTKRIIRHLEIWISHIILEESANTTELPSKFLRILNNKAARQTVIDELIRCKKSFSGSVAENIVKLYESLGLKQDSVKKLKNSRQWYTKARGIQELFLMEQMDFLTQIYKNTNNKNELVRMEAQTGIIHMTGFAGLRFLNVISYPLTEWQQIKLLEQLRLTREKEDLTMRIPKWLLSKNDTVVVFALKLADEYQQFPARDAVIDCLSHSNPRIRSQAVKTLLRLADPDTPSVLIRSFDQKEQADQLIILDALVAMATDEQSDFLGSLLDHPDNTIKLKAAIVLATCCENGIDILNRKAAAEPEPYNRILRHVKTIG